MLFDPIWNKVCIQEEFIIIKYELQILILHI